MSVPGLWELMIIGGVVLLLFGGRKLPQLGGAIGESIKNFKKGIADSEPKAVNPAKSETDTPSDSKHA